MICEKILGSIHDEQFQGCEKDYVDIEWYEAFKKLHRKVSHQGREIGIRMENEILTRGLRDGDVIGCEAGLLIAVNTPPCDMIKIGIDPGHQKAVAKMCYEVGNRHATLLWGEEKDTFLTPYNEPMFALLSKMHGLHIKRVTGKLRFDKSISATVNNHSH